MERTNEFGQFDVVSDDSDHQFLGSNNGECFADSKSGVHSTIMREWKILQQNLPDSIYVRVYERRIDLMRAAIVGAAGTPYHDGLFFFDIMFPSDYPKHPPKLHFHSFGLKLNPNLYRDGQLCLSLLNTWFGKKREKWDPSGSTMLQVLLSIQALVLNEKPFFNEAGAEAFGRVFDFESRSRVYNEDVFIFTCYTSLYLLRRPPRNFEAFVAAHFRERAFTILAACNEYANGRVRIGYYSCELRSSSSTVQVSRRFTAWLIRFYPRLLREFRQNGASLGGLVEHLELENEQSENKSSQQREQPKGKRSGIFKKVVKKIKRSLGWKKNGKKKTSENEGRDHGLEST
ncbi:putative ubiquitin-conjugating enzyme E2 38 [Spatholobus suberectus]|nr:putative ubiquitin-conjugating enzyme E2 38 [Spatholobus suberectus]